jgi:hypothetical protein
MAGPWEQYQEVEVTSGPWDNYAPVEAPAPKKTLSRTDKYIKGVEDPIVGMGQLTQHMLPKGIQQSAATQMNKMGAPMGVQVQPGQLDQQIAHQEQQYQEQRTAGGESGIDGYRMLGNVLNPLTLMPSTKIPQAVSLAGRVATGVGVGGAMGAMQPVTSGDFDAEKGKQIGAGALGGAVVPLAVAGGGRLISPKASVNPNVQALRKEGVTPTIGQTMGGAWNKLEDRLQSLPIMGDMISSARGKANAQFETAAYNKALKPIGQKLPDGLSGREALNFTESTLKNNYDDVLNKIGAITPDEQFHAKVGRLESLVNKKVMPKAEKQKFTAALNDIKESMDENGVITSEAYKDLESSLGSDARKLGGSQNIYEGKIAPAVKQLQAELKDMLKRQAGEHADELQKQNAGWANFKRVQKASTSLGADDGAFSPAQFQNAVKASDKSKDKAAFARGGALGQDLGDAGKSVLTGKVPNSGTAERLLYGGSALATGALNPAIPVGLLGGAAMYSQPAQRFLTGILANRPDSAPMFAEALRKNSNYLLPAGAAAGYGLLNQ